MAALCPPPRLRPPRLRPVLWKAGPPGPRRGGVSEGVRPGRAGRGVWAGPGWRSCQQQGPHTVPSWLCTPGTGHAPPNWGETLCGFNSHSGLSQDSLGGGVGEWGVDLLGQRPFQSCLFSYWPRDGFQESQPRSKTGSLGDRALLQADRTAMGFPVEAPGTEPEGRGPGRPSHCTPPITPGLSHRRSPPSRTEP